jgi:hypothetical protein
VPKNILRAWKNFLRFGLSYFSIFSLIKTLFLPWRRYRVSYPRGFDAWTYFEVFISNMIFRVLGAIFRIALIITGLIFEIIIIFSGSLILLGWLFLPLFLFLGFYHGIRLLS